MNIALACLLAGAVYAKRGCFQCGGREGYLCYIILACLCGYLILLGLGLLIFGVLGRCCGSGAYGKQHLIGNSAHHMSMEIPTHHDTGANNQNQFQGNTLFDQRDGLHSQTNVNQNLTLGGSNQDQMNKFRNNHLISQAETNIIHHDLPIPEERRVTSDESVGNISISPPTSALDTPYSSNSEHMSRYKKRQKRSNYDHASKQEYAQDFYRRRNMQNTRNVRVDSDDENDKQLQILAALSTSRVSRSDLEISDFESVRKSVDFNKRKFLKDKYYHENRFETSGLETGESRRPSYSPKAFESDGWEFSKKNYYETSQDEYGRPPRRN